MFTEKDLDELLNFYAKEKINVAIKMLRLPDDRQRVFNVQKAAMRNALLKFEWGCKIRK